MRGVGCGTFIDAAIHYHHHHPVNIMTAFTNNAPGSLCAHYREMMSRVHAFMVKKVRCGIRERGTRAAQFYHDKALI